MTAWPLTAWHYAPNANFSSGNVFLPGAMGFNLADVSSASQMPLLPAGVKALVYLGYTSGNTPAFQTLVNAYASYVSQIFAFYIADEPIPVSAGGTVTAANMQAEVAYIHTTFNLPCFITLYNEGPDYAPSYSTLSPSATGLDYYGVEGYPVKPGFSGGYNLSVIGANVAAAAALGVSTAQMIPVYQAFGATGGAYVTWGIPTTLQMQQMLATWTTYLPNPVFDMAYAYGTQLGDAAIATLPFMQTLFSTIYLGTAVPNGNPGLIPLQTPTASQWNGYFTAKTDAEAGIADNPTLTGAVLLTTLQASTSYANDAAAATGGVAIGQLYRNGNIVQIRLS